MSQVISELLHCNFVALNRDYGGSNFVTVDKGLFSVSFINFQLLLFRCLWFRPKVKSPGLIKPGHNWPSPETEMGQAAKFRADFQHHKVWEESSDPELWFNPLYNQIYRITLRFWKLWMHLLETLYTKFGVFKTRGEKVQLLHLDLNVKSFQHPTLEKKNSLPSYLSPFLSRKKC